MKKLLFSLAVSCGLLTADVSAQCMMGSTGGTNVNASTGFTWAQSFTTTCSGNLSYVEFIANANGTVSAGTLNIYNGNAVTGSIYSQPFPAMTVTMGGPIRVNITGLVPVMASTQYTFEFFVDVNVLASFTDVYAGGHAWENGVAYTGVDFDFNVSVTNSSSGMSDFEFASLIQTFPNPASDVVNVVIGKDISDATIDLMTIDGRLLLQKKILEPVTQLYVLEFERGFYLVRVRTKDNVAVFRVSRQ